MHLMVQGQPMIVGWHSGGINRNTIEFFGEAPESGEMVLLGVGVVVLAGLVRLRRR